ncbi:hypothetical protein Tco_0415679 [Tanacetum coccineum]
MAELKPYNSDAYDWLMKIPAEQWSRAYFLGRAKCDLLLNNICEVFNRQLVDGRDQPIITCVKYIKEYLMKRIVVVQKVIAKTVRPLTPFVTALFDAIKKNATEYIVQWNGGYLYQELTGIPCKHVVAAIYNMFENLMGVAIPEQWVHAAYRLETRAHVYSFKVNLCNGREMWSVVESRTVIILSLYKPQVGRPPKKRKKSHDEIVNESCGASQVGGSSQAGARNVSGQAGTRQAVGAKNVSGQAASTRNALVVLVNPVQHKAQQLVQRMPQVKLLVLVNLVQHQEQ